MTDRVHLIGADDVRSAGYVMREAADGMKQAAMNFDGALERHQRFMEDWLQRFEAVTDKLLPKAAKCKCGVCDPVAQHPCPYRVNMSKDTTTLCTCCSSCQDLCAQEIP